MGKSYATHYRTFWYNMLRYGLKLSKDEFKQIVTTVLIIAFVWSFNDWGGETFDFVVGIKNFLLGVLFATIGLFFNQIGQRLVAVYYGYDPIYEYGMLGLMIAFVLAFASRGILVFFFPGQINLRHLAASRLGEFRYYTSDWEWAKAGFQGVFFNILIASILAPFRHIDLVRQLMIMNLLFAWFSLIPLPGSIGIYLFYPNIYTWVLAVGFVVAATILMFFLSPILTIILSMVIGGITLFMNYFKYGPGGAPH